MAQESEDGQEKSEEPTERKREQAREKGQVPRSRELTTTFLMLASSILLYSLGGYMGRGLEGVMKSFLTIDRAVIFGELETARLFWDAIGQGLMIIAPMALVLLVVAVGTPALLGGWLMTFESMTPSLEKMNPLKGLKRMFGFKGLVELGKGIGKVAVVGSSAWLVYSMFEDDFLLLSSEPLHQLIAHAADIIFWAFLIMSCSLILIAAIDVPFQLHEHTKQLKMTKQEVKEEFKDTEGKPEVKSKIRQMQHQIAMGRMMDKVPEADVVVTNPTHFAVALKYDQIHMDAPKVVAKGTDLIAARIREIARENDIPLFEAPPLARALYHTTQIDGEVPSGLYVAVAQVLAYVYQLRNAWRYRTKQPQRPDPEVPEEFEKYTKDTLH